MNSKKSPLWLPSGSVRAIIALTVVGAGVGMFIARGDIPQAFTAIIGLVVGYYFGKKAGEEKPET